MRRRLRPLAFPLLLSILLPLVLSAELGESRVELVGKAVTGAVESLSKKILNTTATNTTDDDTRATYAGITTEIPASHGRAALDEARRAASVKPTNVQVHTIQQCGPVCIELSTLLLTAVEGPICRTLFTTGKCPGNCMAEIAGITGNSSWATCGNCDGDVVSGAGERWASLCGSRQETFIDASKEAVKTLVGDGLGSGIGGRAVMQSMTGVLILLLGIGYGYRRGRVMAFKIGKKRHGRKNSDANLPV